MIPRNWKKVLIISLVVSVMFTVAQSLLFGSSVTYSMSAEDWDKVYSMKYGEASEFMLARAHKSAGWEGYLAATWTPRFWLDLAKIWLFFFILSLSSCAGLLVWLGRSGT